MSNIQVKDVPEALHRRLRQYAKRHHRTIGDVVLQAVEKELARADFSERLSKRTKTALRQDAASLLAEERSSGDGA